MGIKNAKNSQFSSLKLEQPCGLINLVLFLLNQAFLRSVHAFVVLMVTNTFVVLTLFSCVTPAGVSHDKSTVSFN